MTGDEHAPTLLRQIGRLYVAAWRQAAGRRGAVAAFLALLAGAQATRLAVPYFFGTAVNALQLSGGQDLAGAAVQMTAMLAACVLAWGLHFPGRIIERYAAISLRERFADTIYAKLMALPLRWHERNHSGEVMQRLDKAVGALFSFMQNQFVYLQNLISLVGPIVALCLVSLASGTAAIAGYAFIAVLLVRFDREMLRLIGAENAADRRYRAELVDCLGNVATVLTLRLQEPTRRTVAGRLAEVSTPLRRNVMVNETKWCAIDLLNNLICLGVVALYAWMSWRETGAVLIGTAVMVHQYAQQIGGVVGSMATHWQALVRYSADIGSADPILAAAPAVHGAPVPADWRRIDVRGLTFSHVERRGAAPCLDSVSLTLERGGRVALVGESGSGKSTLLRVLIGLYQPDSVAIAVDGITRLGVRDLSSVAMLVPQDPEIFESSIGQNVTMGLDHPPEAVARALRLARLQPLIEALPRGVDTDVTERGLNLSGGQKQRLALARGILAARGSSVIMLDEPTSSIDPLTELAIYDSLLGEFPDACIVSSIHRLHLLARFDTVVLMADGKVVDAGSMDDLLARQPRFRTMWHAYVASRGAEEEAVPA